MMAVLWVIFILASTGLQLVRGFPINPTPRIYPQDTSGLSVLERWSTEGGLYAALPVLALVVAAAGLLFGCTWCYRHKDCKPNEGADNQIFTASVTHLHDARRSQPPDSGFSEPANNNISEDNNNGPISLREMQNIANNNAAAYIVSENEERNRISRESVVEFEPLPSGIGVLDPLERCADWFAGEDLPRNRLQYLREIGRGWFGRVVEGEIDDGSSTSTVAVKILNQNASLEDKARFLDEARLYRDASHENILPFVAKCLQEDPWILIFELCSMDLQQYLIENRPKMAILNENGVPLQLMCDVSSALAYLHSRGHLYPELWSGSVLVRDGERARALLGRYAHAATRAPAAPEAAHQPHAHQPHAHTASSDVWALGFLVWEVCAWGAAPAPQPPPPDLPCPYRNHLYQVMQLCWNPNPEDRPSAAQVHALINHLHITHARANDTSKDDGYGSSDFEERWQRLKPNTIPKLDEHIAIVHAPSTSMTSHFTGSDQEFDNAQTIHDSLSVEMDTAVSRSSSIMSDKDPLSVQIKSDSLTNLHGSLEDVRNIYLTHNEAAALECHQGNMCFEDREKEQDRSDSSMDPWIKDIIADGQDDVSYFKDVSDVIKNLDNILNSEKTSSSESSHQASPSRDNLSLECKNECPIQTSMVKSPGISNFKNILQLGFDTDSEVKSCEDDDGDHDTIGNLSHSFERHSDSTSQQTLENITPETPIKDLDISISISQTETITDIDQDLKEFKQLQLDKDLPKDISVDCSHYSVPKLKELCVATSIISEKIDKVSLKVDCISPVDFSTDVGIDSKETKSVDNNEEEVIKFDHKNIENTENDKHFIEENILDLEKCSTVPELYDDALVNDIFIKKHTIKGDVTSDPYLADSFYDELSTNNVNQNKYPGLDKSGNESTTITPLDSLEAYVEITTENLNTDLSHDLSVDNARPNTILTADSHKTFITNTSDLDNNQSNEHNDKLNERGSPKIVKFSDVGLKDVVNDIYNQHEYTKRNDAERNASIVQSQNDLINTRHPIKEEEVFSTMNDKEIEIEKSNITNLSVQCSECVNQVPDSLDRTNIIGSEHIQNSGNKTPETVSHNHSVIVEQPENICSNIINNETFNVTESEEITSNSILHHSSLKQLDLKEELPETVQILSITTSLDTDKFLGNENEIGKTILTNTGILTDKHCKPEEVQNVNHNIPSDLEKKEDVCDVNNSINRIYRSDSNNEKLNITDSEQTCNSTIYMDLSNSEVAKNNYLSTDVIEHGTVCLQSPNAIENFTSSINESTVYLDLPSIIRETGDFLHSEKILSSRNVNGQDYLTSTPKGSENSTESTLEAEDDDVFSRTKAPVQALIETFTKPGEKHIVENESPFESPSKSHHTDTYDENSSVVLGPFENCTFESLKSIKSTVELVDLPKEELLAFSSNFSEINLETPSPLRDGNFLNEVPDIAPDEMHFDSIQNIEENPNVIETHSDNTNTGESSTEKRVSPSTPPNSPGILLVSSSQQKYLVDIDITAPNNFPTNPSIEEAIDLDHIEFQMNKLAMAENENNMNLEYSGPLLEDLRPEESELVQYKEEVPESYLAGNGSVENIREVMVIDEDRMKELRNELELKLPLAQVSGIAPADAWAEQGLPAPPELVLVYGALSPIAEETRNQLSAYERDDHWNYSARTESSESYPEPCNNSTDDVTDLPTGMPSALHLSHEHSTYTLPSKENSINNTYTLQMEVISSKELTMSADSLNGSPLKKLNDVLSSIDDRTYTKNDEDKESHCERLSQVSPFLLSPTTDTSVPDCSDLAPGLSTLSKTTIPTDAKSSKPSETQCLSKATSIDSWCSNDTLYNVEENFDDLAMDPDIPLEFEPELENKSESEDTLTHNDDEKELSHCSTYIVHDSKSEVCETFSPDSITAKDNCTYTKVKTDVAGTTPSINTKSDLNDSTKNTQTKDLAYGTLMSEMPSYSNCTTELASAMDETWKLPQPELVRRSPIPNDVHFTPPKNVANESCCMDKKETESPHVASKPLLNKMDSVEITCLKDDSVINKSELSEDQVQKPNDSPNRHFRSLAPSVTSTPFSIPADNEIDEPIPLVLPQINLENSSYTANSLTNFQEFLQSAEIRPQDISSNVNECASTEILLEGESRTLSRDSNRDVSERTPTYSDFEYSALAKPQDLSSKEKSSQSLETEINSEEFLKFENSVKNCPQDLSSLIDASSLLLKSERLCSDIALGSLANIDFDLINKSENSVTNTDTESPALSSNFTNLLESHNIDNNPPMNVFMTDMDMEEDTEQPHSIIITESPLVSSKLTPNRTFDSHTKSNYDELNQTFESHNTSFQAAKNLWGKDNTKSEQPNKAVQGSISEDNTAQSPDCSKDFLKTNSIITTAPLQEDLKVNTTDRSVEQENCATVLESNKNLTENIKITCNGSSEVYATVNFLNENFEELVESNVDDNDLGITDSSKLEQTTTQSETTTDVPVEGLESLKSLEDTVYETSNESNIESAQDGKEDSKVASVTNDFLQNEKKFAELDVYFPLLSDIRFTGPATEIMTTSFTQDSPTDPTSPECEQDSKPDPTADILKEWDSDSDSHSTNSSSGEFIWKDGDGRETALVPSTHFDHQRDSGSQPSNTEEAPEGEAPSSGSGDSGSGSEGDEVEFVPSSWDCRAAPSKSSLRSMEQTQDNKKRVVFKRQKYHCVYEYPREVADIDVDSPAYLPDFSTYSDWDATSAEDAELGYGQLFGAPNPLDLFPLRSSIAFGADYDEDFYISSSARPFESLGVMSSSSQFFPGMHVKGSLLEREFPDITDDFPPPPSPLPTLVQTRTPSLDFTTPDSGVEDITPGSMAEDDFKAKKLPEESTQCWRSVDSTSSSESVSPSSPGGEALGGLRHTRDKLKLDLPPSPHIPSPKHNRVFNFVLEKPKRQERAQDVESVPLVMTDETPVITSTLQMPKESDDVMPEPTFSTFGKSTSKPQDAEKNIVLTDDNNVAIEEIKEENSKKVEPVKGEGTVLDSGDEDSGIESSSKATLERNKPTPNVT